MSNVASLVRKSVWLACTSVLVLASGLSSAAPLNIPPVPLYLPESTPPLNMLVLGRDHKLYYEAYNDASDLNDDGVLDIGYKGYIEKSPKPAAPESPYKIDYYGYFDSFKCYTHDGSQFNPVSYTATKKCSSSAKQWSGDFLNYVTTARIDALRKVLYGGYRSTDTDTSTILERTHIPQDAHSWGKEYGSLAHDGYLISDYTPLSQPTTSRHHLFANTTLLRTGTGEPLLRVLQNSTVRVWNWLSIEQPVAGTQVVTGINSEGKEIRSNVTPVDYTVRVAVCTGVQPLEPNCQAYGSSTKPIGLLQEFGEKNAMYFGLLSGSYAKNKSGGVLRSNIGSVASEINPGNGTFVSGTNGIIATLNRFRTSGFGVVANETDPKPYQYRCGWDAANRVINEGECQMWGNPIAEMMYETLRYFSGAKAPTSAFSTSVDQGDEKGLGLPVATWKDPYAERAVCSKAFETVISDINPSYDSDQLPGSAFGGGISNTLPGSFDVSQLGQLIWNNDMGAPGRYFIGESGAESNGAPTPKTVSSFGNIRGLSPEEPTKQGSYNAASVAYYGHITDLNTTAAGDQKVNTIAVALASPLPQIKIPVTSGGTTKTITLIPYGKSVGGSYSITAKEGSFQPTNQIVDFYVDTLTPTSGSFRVNFEDVEQGADHDMDAIVLYDYKVNSNGTVTVSLKSEYAAGGIVQHLGFVVSGSTEDGTYLGVRDTDTLEANDPDYFLDTPNTASKALPLTYSRTFTPGGTGATSTLKDPLWYAAKWGGFDETIWTGADDAAKINNLPDNDAEWVDPADTGVTKDPANYYLVTNALRLSEQLRKAFSKAVDKPASLSSAAVNSGSINLNSRLYQARFNPKGWTGQLLAYNLSQTTGAVVAKQWDVNDGDLIPKPASRRIVTTNTDHTPVAFRWTSADGNSLDATRKGLLGVDTSTNKRGPLLLDYLRGDDSNEGTGQKFRVRKQTDGSRSKIGDIVSSSPLYVGRPAFRYKDSLDSPTYSSFATPRVDRPGMIYTGANDGMLHAFNEKGEEEFAFIPSPMFSKTALTDTYSKLENLSNPSYSHQFYVDGPVSMGDAVVNIGGTKSWRTVLLGGLNAGGQGIYALNITDPSTFKNAEANPAGLVMWEFLDRKDASNPKSQGDPDLGFTFSQPSIVKMADGNWAAVFGNGYNSGVADGSVGTGNAVLYVVDIATGALIRKIDTMVGGDNGLSTPALVDADNDGKVESAYAGDLKGNMWKFDLASKDPAQWGVAFTSGSTPAPLFAARDSNGVAQPITGRPEVARGPQGEGVVVLFGTGKFLEPDDRLLPPLAPERRQSFYGIIDKNTRNASDRVSGSRADTLVEQTILAEVTLPDPDDKGPLTGKNLRATSAKDLGTKRGWFIDLVSKSKGYQGEKSVSNPTVRNGNVIFTTLIPSRDPCIAGGTSWIMEMNATDGGRTETSAFDLNNDGQFTDSDKLVPITQSDGSVIYVYASGTGTDDGIVGSPVIVDGNFEKDGVTYRVQYKYLPDSEGNIQQVTENPGAGGTGRQSWRQTR